MHDYMVSCNLLFIVYDPDQLRTTVLRYAKFAAQINDSCGCSRKYPVCWWFDQWL